MKLRLLFLLILLSAFCKTQAQNTFAPIGASWNYVGQEKWYNYWAGEAGPDFSWNDHVVATDDTTILGQVCSRLEITRTRRDGFSHGISVLSPTYQYVYNNTDTTFYFDQDSLKFYPLYVWNVTDGDTLKLPHLNKRAPGFYLVVDSVRVGLYDTSHLKVYYTTSFIDTADSAHQILNWGGFIDHNDGGIPNFVQQSHGGYIEKLGGFKGLFPNFTSTNPDGLSDILNPAGILICYKDSVMNMRSTDYSSCDSVPGTFYISAVNDVSKLNGQITVSPNPAFNQINIQSKLAFEKNSQLEIRDILGRTTVQAISLNQKKSISIDVSKWTNGIYFLKFSIGEQAYYQKVIVQH
jgi:hypothetical protein